MSNIEYTNHTEFRPPLFSDPCNVAPPPGFLSCPSLPSYTLPQMPTGSAPSMFLNCEATIIPTVRVKIRKTDGISDFMIDPNSLYDVTFVVRGSTTTYLKAVRGKIRPFTNKENGMFSNTVTGFTVDYSEDFVAKKSSIDICDIRDITLVQFVNEYKTGDFVFIRYGDTEYRGYITNILYNTDNKVQYICLTTLDTFLSVVVEVDKIRSIDVIKSHADIVSLGITTLAVNNCIKVSFIVDHTVKTVIAIVTGIVYNEQTRVFITVYDTATNTEYNIPVWSVVNIIEETYSPRFNIDTFEEGDRVKYRTFGMTANTYTTAVISNIIVVAGTTRAIGVVFAANPSTIVYLKDIENMIAFPYSTNANIAGITITPSFGSVVPAMVEDDFSVGIYNIVGDQTEETQLLVSMTATLEEPDKATYTGMLTNVVIWTPQADQTIKDITKQIVVTAEDGVTTKTHNITFHLIFLDNTPDPVPQT